VADEAAQEAERLVKLLRVNPAQLLCHAASSLQMMLPSIFAWYENPVHNTDKDANTNVNSEDVNKSTYGDDSDEDNDADELQTLVQAEEHSLESCTNKQNNELFPLTCVSLTVTAEDLIKV
jgi:hypothetical protein